MLSDSIVHHVWTWFYFLCISSSYARHTVTDGSFVYQNNNIVRPLLDLLKEANQQIPDWLKCVLILTDGLLVCFLCLFVRIIFRNDFKYDENYWKLDSGADLEDMK